ncbi:hypothetical protein ABT294_43130 [Nonomuraea sp. NPDC000554]|uniref:hypothetical protein n=1 Tax=Nonomuraea sp. NPDC000554 TaxID=3154259 RepID=UPI0033170D2D
MDRSILVAAALAAAAVLTGGCSASNGSTQPIPTDSTTFATPTPSASRQAENLGSPAPTTVAPTPGVATSSPTPTAAKTPRKAAHRSRLRPTPTATAHRPKPRSTPTVPPEVPRRAVQSGIHPGVL